MQEGDSAKEDFSSGEMKNIYRSQERHEAAKANHINRPHGSAGNEYHAPTAAPASAYPDAMGCTNGVCPHVNLQGVGGVLR